MSHAITLHYQQYQLCVLQESSEKNLFRSFLPPLKTLESHQLQQVREEYKLHSELVTFFLRTSFTHSSRQMKRLVAQRRQRKFIIIVTPHLL